MRVENRTRYPTREVRAIVARHLSRARPRAVIVLEREDPRSGEDPRQGFFRYADRSIRIWLARPDIGEYPFSSSYDPGHAPRGRGSFPKYEVCDWREELLTTAVHEAEHVRAFDRGGDRAVDELAAERRALRALGQHRRRRSSWLRRLLGI